RMVFFFQAEDGIRDGHVTGVQTCALPISRSGLASRLRRAIRDAKPDLVHSNGVKMHLLSSYASNSDVPIIWHVHDYVSSRPVTRSEERRVGKECRDRRWSDDCKEKRKIVW